MRAMALAFALGAGGLVAGSLVACTPEIVSGAYLCGPDESCPEDQVCNGPDNTCVLAAMAQPFACLPEEEHEPDDTAAQGLALPMLDCVSSQFVDTACLADGDGADWVTFATPSVCAAVEVQVRLSFPVAFEPLMVALYDGAGATQLATSAACTQGVDVPGEDQQCLTMTLTPGADYALQVTPAGGGDCDGGCAYNRYVLTVRLATPG